MNSRKLVRGPAAGIAGLTLGLGLLAASAGPVSAQLRGHGFGHGSFGGSARFGGGFGHGSFGGPARFHGGFGGGFGFHGARFHGGTRVGFSFFFGGGYYDPFYYCPPVVYQPVYEPVYVPAPYYPPPPVNYNNPPAPRWDYIPRDRSAPDREPVNPPAANPPATTSPPPPPAPSVTPAPSDVPPPHVFNAPSQESGDYYLNRPRVGPRLESGLADAVKDIETAFRNGDVESLEKHVRAQDSVVVESKGRTRRPLSGSDYLVQTQDALKGMHTVSYKLDHVVPASNGAWMAYGAHVLTGDDGEQQTFNVSFVLKKAGDRWLITEVSGDPAK